jgi:hypothetical protein
MVTGPPLPQEWGLPQRRIGAHNAGQGRAPRCIYEAERLLRRCRPVLSAGHVSVHQRAIAASSRWRARHVEAPAHMGGVLDEATLDTDHRGHALRGQHLASEALDFGAMAPRVGQTRQLVGSQPAGCATRWALA